MDRKVCTKCGETKLLTDFSPRKLGIGGRHSRCKKCRSEDQRGAYAADPEPHRASASAWAKANPVEHTAKGLRWAAAHLDNGRARTARHRQSNPERWAEQNRAAAHRRRVTIAGGEFERFDDTEIFERDEWMCQVQNCVCPGGRAIDPKLKNGFWRVSLDHAIPVSRGGSHTRSNVQAAHFRCNLLKGTRLE